jgi:ABC-type cobalamin/Fe3+-siderophores transport system ATPase subunit
MKGPFFKMLHDFEASLDDAVVVFLADEPTPRPIEKLSLGQRCVAILNLVLLTASDVPVVIDQPEDDLDNSYVFSELVQTLRNARGQRQLILVTHNPNIPIGGDADQVFVMMSDGTRAWIEESGAVDSIGVRRHLLRTLEGGRRAFELRRQRYEPLQLT